MSWEKEKPKKGKKVVIKKPVVKEKPPEPIQEETVPTVPQGPLCICGKPVAVGQSEVCVDHIRRG